MSRKIEYAIDDCYACPYHSVADPENDEDMDDAHCLELNKDFTYDEAIAGDGFPGWCPLAV